MLKFEHNNGETMMVVGVDGEEFCSLDQTVAETLLNWMGVRKTWRS